MAQGLNRVLKSIRGDSGSALLLAIFALTLLASVGITLLFVAERNVTSTRSNLRVKATFYAAEGGQEDGREELRQWNIASGNISLDEELDQAAGANNAIDFDPAAVRPIHDASGNVTGFTGVGDDVPLRALTVDADGYTRAAYLMNDPAEGRTTTTDTNLKLVVAGLAAGPDRSFELVESIVEHYDPVPGFGATITLLGQNPFFDGGNSNVKYLTGNNCDQPVPPAFAVPVVGVQGSSAEALAETGVDKPHTYVEGSETGVDTIDDISGSLDPRWEDCWYLRDLAEQIRDMADVVGNSSTPISALGTPADPKIVFIEGDYDYNGNSNGGGILWVTGELRYKGTVSYDGIIFVVGEGSFVRYGSGNGHILGGAIVANISGPDDTLFTADDCSGPDGIPGNGDDGLGDGASWHATGGGTGDTIYCDQKIDMLRTRWPFRPLDFRQR